MPPGGKQSVLASIPNSRYPPLMYDSVRHAAGGVKIVVSGPKIVNVDVVPSVMIMVVFDIVVGAVVIVMNRMERGDGEIVSGCGTRIFPSIFAFRGSAAKSEVAKCAKRAASLNLSIGDGECRDWRPEIFGQTRFFMYSFTS